ncbi:hypothetical protein BG011_009531 [Mortierella polycephala]|uniref:Ras GEF n=1 Tax=Mortierella polycephala TaxID=41804 RepID=A0A9P6Q9I1_9FUNG|nr:hypothetical protein BG011_009531 [Mortierella polycephala]
MPIRPRRITESPLQDIDAIAPALSPPSPARTSALIADDSKSILTDLSDDMETETIQFTICLPVSAPMQVLSLSHNQSFLSASIPLVHSEHSPSSTAPILSYIVRNVPVGEQTIEGDIVDKNMDLECGVGLQDLKLDSGLDVRSSSALMDASGDILPSMVTTPVPPTKTLDTAPGMEPSSAVQSTSNPDTSSIPPMASGNRVIMAATVENLVEMLTSEIDYTFLTDFFLVYRLFITPMGLLKLIILRFKWALIDNSPQRQIVRIRSFVTLRHWLLNYFEFDFMPSKDLRQTLSRFLRLLMKDPLVVQSTRDQRIVKELRRYSQSLIKEHYKAMAPKQSEEQDHMHRRHLRRTMPVEYPEASNSRTHKQGLTSSRRSSSISRVRYRQNTTSESIVGEWMKEQRTTGKSKKGYVSDDSTDNNASQPSAGSSIFDSEDEYDGCESATEDMGRKVIAIENMLVEQRENLLSDSGDIQGEQVGSTDTSKHRSLRHSQLTSPTPIIGSGSLQTRYLNQTVQSSTRSTLLSRRARPELPNLHRQELIHDHFDLIEMCKRCTRSHSQPLSCSESPLPHSASPLSVQGSLRSTRSCKPYMNPPPRATMSKQQKMTWTQRMSATVGRLSSVKRVFSSGSNAKHQRPRPSSSTQPAHGGGGRAVARDITPMHPTRYWKGTGADFDDEEASRCLLGSCTGISMRLSSMNNRHNLTHRNYGAEKNRRVDDIWDDWSSEDDLAYEMTTKTSQKTVWRNGQDHMETFTEQNEEVSMDLGYENKHNGAGPLSHLQQQSASSRAVDEDDMIFDRTELATEDIEPANITKTTAGLPPAPVSHRTTQRHNRASWMTHSSTSSTAFRTAPETGRPLSSQAALEREWYTNADHSISRLDRTQQHQQQPQQQRQQQQLQQPGSERTCGAAFAGSASGDQSDLNNGAQVDLRDRQLHPINSARRHSSGLCCTDSWRHSPNDGSAPTASSSRHNSSTYKPFVGSVPTPPTPPTPRLFIDRDSVPISESDLSCFHNLNFHAPKSRVGLKPRLGSSSSDASHPLYSMSDPEIDSLSSKTTQRFGRGIRRQFRDYNHFGHQHLPENSAPTNSRISSWTRGSSIFNQEIWHRNEPRKQHQIINAIPRPLVLEQNESQPPSIVLCFRSEMVAQQLCLIERELLDQVQWYELIDAGWVTKEPARMTSDHAVNPKSRDGANEPPPEAPSPDATAAAFQDAQSGIKDRAGVKRLVDRFNLTCQWVTSEIILTRDLDMRVRVVEKFIRIAQTCYNHSNFSSLMQLMLGLQAHSVSRLRRTWSRVRAREISIMQDLVEFTSPFHNWKHIRDAMKSVADEWGGSSSANDVAMATMTEGHDTFLSYNKTSFKSRVKLATAAKSGFVPGPALVNGLESSNAALPVSPSSQLKGSSAPAQTPTGPWGRNEKEHPSVGHGQGTMASQPRGCIPFLGNQGSMPSDGLYLSDLVFNSELPSSIEQQDTDHPLASNTSAPSGASTKRELVNIHKHRTTATIIKRVLKFRMMASRFPFQKEADVHALLMAIEGLSPTEMSRLSYEREEQATYAG